MNNIVMRKIVVTAQYQPLSDKDVEVVTVDVSTPPTNANVVFFRGDNGVDVPWIAGEYHTLKRINLAEVMVRGQPGDVVTLVGGTW